MHYWRNAHFELRFLAALLAEMAISVKCSGYAD